MGGLWHLTHWRWERCLLAVGPHFNTFCCYHPLAVGTLLTFGLNMLPSCPLAVGICLLFAAFSWMFTQWCPQWLYITHWQHHLHNFYWGIWWLSIHKCDFILIGSGWCCMNNFWQSGDRVPIFTHWRGEFYRVMESTIHKMVHLKRIHK